MIIKEKQRLESALNKIEDFKQEHQKKMCATDFHELIKLIEVNNMTLGAELFLKSSLIRTESRRDHYREDYPERDDENWLKWICVAKNPKTSEPNFYTEPINVDKSILSHGGRI